MHARLRTHSVHTRHDRKRRDDENDDGRNGSSVAQVVRVARSCRAASLRHAVVIRHFRPSHFPPPDARQDSAKGPPTSTMSDEGFNPCECMWNYMSVQHLLSILRQSQDYCSDTECFSLSRLPGPQTNVRESSDFLFTCLIIGFLVLLYAFRPRSLRSTRKSSNEPGSHGGDGPPSPPTMI